MFNFIEHFFICRKSLSILSVHFSLSSFDDFNKGVNLKNIIRKSLFSILIVSVVGCSDSDSDIDNDTISKFSLGLSDAPVDDAEAVFIELDSISLTKANDDGTVQEVLIDRFTNENGETIETVQVNLLDFQGSSQVKIVDEAQNIELENDVYAMELNVIDSGSYVLLDKDATEYPIKVPSNRLRLGEFTVTSDAVQISGQPAYTVEFDLRQSLVQRGNSKNNNGYIIKPHGVRIVSLAGGIEGTISSDLTNLGQCTVYLYDSAATEYGDMYDESDDTFVAPDTTISASAPLATAHVTDDGTYAIGFIEAGSYQVALTCGTDVDDNVQFDGLTIPSAADITPDVQSVVVVSQQTTTADFN